MEYCLLYYLALSLLLFVLFGFDKAQAKRKGRRIAEKTLYLWGILGGFAGGFLGMLVFRHKTQKPFFSLCYLFALVAHLLFWSYLIKTGVVSL
ncbi:MAG: DUF1294 domain-containing protein [Clostridia bacterium]|nr:DUF1294 domain-containing protein [Clostridia bacterium]